MTTADERSPYQSNQENPVRFVEALADEHDYWLSLTDAARITRTSEAMARRWVSSGRLPIRKEPVGINQRTRLVRASDVARLRPIVDPSAAITDDIHKLDLLSITRQQQQIQQEQHELQSAVQALQTKVRQDKEATHTAIVQVTTQLQQLTQHGEQQFEDLQKAWHRTLDHQQHQYEAVIKQITGHTQDIERLSIESREQGLQHHQQLKLLRTWAQDQFEHFQARLQEMCLEMEHQLVKQDQDQ
ncbi:MAG TPA: helix-turn-helix domain-containing protein [Ktedonobacteraceae bacterium]